MAINYCNKKRENFKVQNNNNFLRIQLTWSLRQPKEL
jgi:hypothetical protein